MKFIRRIVKDCNSIVFLDFEATDSSMEIISIGAIKAELDSKKQIKSYDKGFKCYVYTETKISPFIEEMTGITNELLDKEGISFEEAINRLSKYVGDPTHINEYDRNLNGLSAQDLIERFAPARMQDMEKDKSELGKTQYTAKSEYKVVRIDSFEQARQYGKYNDWCLAQPNGKGMFDRYTSDGVYTNQLIFLKGFTF